METANQLASLLKSSFDPYFKAPIEAWAEYAEKCEIVDVPKDTTLKRANTPERYFFFIVSGAVGLFLQAGNNSVCLDFAFERQFCADYMSVVTRAATPLELVTLEACSLARMPLRTFLELGETPMGNQLMRISAESSFVDKQQQQIDLLTKSSTQRLIELEERFPRISERIALKHIASYLGITPQSLSRLRSAQQKLSYGKNTAMHSS